MFSLTKFSFLLEFKPHSKGNKTIQEKYAEVQIKHFATQIFWDPSGQIGGKSDEYRCLTILACSILGG